MIPSRILKGQIYLVDTFLENAKTFQATKARPIVVIQNDVGNQQSNEIIGAKITSSDKPPYPFEMSIMLNRQSKISLDKIYTFEKSRLITYIGHLNTKEMMELDLKLAVSLQLLIPRMIYRIEVTDFIYANQFNKNAFYKVLLRNNNRIDQEIIVSAQDLLEYFSEINELDRTNLKLIEEKLNTLRGLKFIDKYLYQYRYNELFSS